MPGHRSTTRLRDFDYRFGLFFISMVCDQRTPLFGEIMNGVVRLSPAGRIISEEWLKTPLIRPSVQLDEWIVMPDHFQALVCINDSEAVGPVGGASWRPCPLDPGSIQDNTVRIQSVQPVPRSLARMINQFKSTSTRRINEMQGIQGKPVWQRGYHDRIIRNEVELDHVREYIRTNPERG